MLSSSNVGQASGVSNSKGVQSQSYCKQIFGNKFIQLTLLVGGILAIVMGNYYLQNVARIVTMSAGGLSLALLIIARCYCSYTASTGQRPSRSRVGGPLPGISGRGLNMSGPSPFTSAFNLADSSPSTTGAPATAAGTRTAPTSSPASTSALDSVPQAVKDIAAATNQVIQICTSKISDAELSRDKIGAAIVMALQQKRAGIEDVTWSDNFSGGKLRSHQGYRVHFQDSTQPAAAPFNVVLKVRVYSPKPDTIYWDIKTFGSGENARLAAAMNVPDGQIPESTLIAIIKGSHDRFKLVPIPDDDDAMHLF